MLSAARRHLGTLSIASIAAALALAPAAAQADPLDFNSCNGQPLSQPFAPWFDFSSYELAPGGDFETSTWSLSGGASIVPGSEPYAATGTLGQYSLSVPAGASAESPATCVDAAYPTVRMFVGGTGEVGVSVVYDGVAIPTGDAVAAGSWVPTDPMLTMSAIPGLLSGGSAQVSLELTGLSGNPQVDDVFIDPMGGH